jgi:hypothetical protein
MDVVTCVDVIVELLGDYPEAASGELALETSSSHCNPFGRAQIDDFVVTGAPVATPSRLRVRTIGKGASSSPDWCLDWVSVQIVVTGQVSYFQFNKEWLRDEGHHTACVPPVCVATCRVRARADVCLRVGHISRLVNEREPCSVSMCAAAASFHEVIS